MGIDPITDPHTNTETHRSHTKCLLIIPEHALVKAVRKVSSVPVLPAHGHIYIGGVEIKRHHKLPCTFSAVCKGRNNSKPKKRDGKEMDLILGFYVLLFDCLLHCWMLSLGVGVYKKPTALGGRRRSKQEEQQLQPDEAKHLLLK